MLTGESGKHHSKGAANILLVSTGDSSLTSIAEAIAEAIADGYRIHGGRQPVCVRVRDDGAGQPRRPAARLPREARNQPFRPRGPHPRRDGKPRWLPHRGRRRPGGIQALASRTLGFRTVVVEGDMDDEASSAGHEAVSTLFDDLLERITRLVQSLHGTVASLIPND